MIGVIWMIVNLHFNRLPENALNEAYKVWLPDQKYKLSWYSNRNNNNNNNKKEESEEKEWKKNTETN